MTDATNTDPIVPDSSFGMVVNTAVAEPVNILPKEYHTLYSPYSEIRAPDSIFSQWQLVTRGSWVSSTAAGNKLYSGTSFVSNLFHTTTSSNYVNAPVARYLSAYRGFRANVEVRVTIHGGFNMSGALMITCSPDANPTLGDSMYCASSDPDKIILSAQDPNSAVYTVRFRSPKYAVIPVANNDPWGNMQIWILSPLLNAAATTTTTINYTIESRFSDVKLYGPNHFVAYQSAVQYKESKHVARTGDSLVPALGKVAKAGWKAVKSASGAINPILPSVLDLLPFSRPIDTSTVQRVTTVTPDVNIQTNSASSARRLGYAPTTPMPQLENPDSLDYTEFANYAAIPGLIYSSGLGPTATPDDVLFSIPVTPSYCHSTFDATYRYGHLTPLSMTALRSLFWRGSLRYNIRIFAPSGSSFAMRVVWIPAAVTGVPTSISSADVGSLINTVINVTGDTSVDIVVPYSHEAPAIPTYSNPGLASVPNDFLCAGYLLFSYVTAPVNQYNISVGPAISVFASGGPDLQFFGSRATVPNMVYQGDVTKSTVDYIAPASPMQIDGYFGVDSLSNWRDWLQIYRSVPSNAYMGALDWSNLAPPYASQLFKYYRGAQRVKFKAGASGVVNWKIYSSGSPSISGGDTVINYDGNENVVLELPFLGDSPWQSTTSPQGYTLGYMFTAGCPANFDVAAADDIQLFGVRRLPIARQNLNQS